jgi:hypothetical protein
MSNGNPVAGNTRYVELVKARRSRARPAFFDGYCEESGFLEDGYHAEPVRRRLRRSELAEAWRLWCRHADIRTGRVKP